MKPIYTATEAGGKAKLYVLKTKLGTSVNMPLSNTFTKHLLIL